MVEPIFLEGTPKKLDVRAKNCFLGQKKGYFGWLGPKNGPQSSQMGTYLKYKGIQIYLRIWGCYDPIESGPSETKKGGLYRCSVKKSDFGAIFWPKNGP